VKPWIALIVAVVALGVALKDPDQHAEGNSVVASISDTVDPYLQQSLGSDTHEELKAHSKEAADFFEQTGAEFGVKLTFDPGE
jgi:hypothetical protein